ncbi:CshA/CshB family fibrillar adhesin-related protein, partial [Ferrimicrobium sp.]|uniref:CshA/CshB family fibrillar adhesin-related protein n=1 Tax=Ferrimicrobium sp. TaxID=2926050 RepID=UPI002618B369
MSPNQLAKHSSPSETSPAPQQYCGVAANDPDASNICWFSYGSYSAPQPQQESESTLVDGPTTTSPSVQALPGVPIRYKEVLPNGDVFSFDLTYKFPHSDSGVPPLVTAVTSPVDWGAAAFGREAYVDLPTTGEYAGNTYILYSQQQTAGGSSTYGPASWSFVLSHMSLTTPSTASSAGVPISPFTLVAADGESTNAGESVTFKTTNVSTTNSTNTANWQPVGPMVLPLTQSAASLPPSPRLTRPSESSLTFANTCGGSSGYSDNPTFTPSVVEANLGIGTDVVSCVGSSGGLVGDLVLSTLNPTRVKATDYVTGGGQEQGLAFGVEIPAAPVVPSAPVVESTPSLSLVKIEASGSPNPITTAGQSVAYDFDVTNTGNTTLNNLSISDTQSVPGEALTGPISCPVTSLAAGASVTCTGTYTVTSTDITNGKVSDTASATATDPAGTTVTSNSSSLTIPVSVPTSA